MEEDVTYSYTKQLTPLSGPKDETPPSLRVSAVWLMVREAVFELQFGDGRLGDARFDGAQVVADILGRIE